MRNILKIQFLKYKSLSCTTKRSACKKENHGGKWKVLNFGFQTDNVGYQVLEHV